MAPTKENTAPTRQKHLKSDYSKEFYALTIGSNLYHRRRYRGLSQQDIAATTGITQASLSEIERGEGNPTLQTLVKLAEALQVPTDLLTKTHINRKMIEAIDYFLQTRDDIDILKAMKLLYFADLDSLQQTGHKITGLEYVRRNRGPFAKEIYQLDTIFDKHETHFKPLSIQTYVALSPDEKLLVEKTIQRYGDKTSVQLMDLSYKTAPMKDYKKGDTKDIGKRVL